MGARPRDAAIVFQLVGGSHCADGVAFGTEGFPAFTVAARRDGGPVAAACSEVATSVNWSGGDRGHAFTRCTARVSGGVSTSRAWCVQPPS